MHLVQFPPAQKKNFIKAFQTASDSAPVQLVTRASSLFSVDGSTDLSAGYVAPEPVM